MTVCFDESGNVIEPEGVCADYDTGSAWPSFAIVKPAIDNTRVDMSPYGQSVFADAVDAVQAVDLAFDAMISEIDNGKMRVFLSDVLFDVEAEGSARVSIPFGRQDCTVFRKVKSVDDVIQEFAPSLRTEAQVEAFRVALQMLGDLCGFGITYFDFDAAGYVKTATEVSADMRSAALRRGAGAPDLAAHGAASGAAWGLPPSAPLPRRAGLATAALAGAWQLVGCVHGCCEDGRGRDAVRPSMTRGALRRRLRGAGWQINFLASGWDGGMRVSGDVRTQTRTFIM